MSRKPNIQPLHWRSNTDYDPDGPIYTAAGAHYRYDIEFVGNINECKLLANGDYVASGGSTQLQALANEHNRRAVKLKTPFRSPLPPAQGDFLVAAGQNKAKVGDIPLIQYRYLHDDLALVDYLADPAIPDWKDFAVMLTERGVEYLEWRDEQFRKRAPATWITEREELRAALAQTKAAFDQVAPTLAKTESELASLKRGMLAYAGEISELSLIDKKKTAVIAELDEKVASLNRLNQETSRALELTREELVGARTAHASIKTELCDYRKRVNEDRSKQEQAFRAAALKRVEEEMAADRAAIAEAQANIASTEAELHRLNRDLEQSLSVRAGLGRDVAEMRRKLADMETDLATARERETDLTRIIEHLREQLARADDRHIEVELDRRRLTEIVKAAVIQPQQEKRDDDLRWAKGLEDISEYARRPDEVKQSGKGIPNGGTKALVERYRLDALKIGETFHVPVEDRKAMVDYGYDYMRRFNRKLSLKRNGENYIGQRVL